MPECLKGKKRKREREKGGGGKKPVSLFPNKQLLAHTLSKHRHDRLGLPVRACPPFPTADAAWPHATKNYVMNSWVPFGFALLRCKPSPLW